MLSVLHAELRAVVRHRRQCCESQIAVEAQLRETLLSYHPAMVALFSTVDCDATLAFLRNYPTPQAAGRVGEARMAGFCGRVGYSGWVSVELLADHPDSVVFSSFPAVGRITAAGWCR